MCFFVVFSAIVAVLSHHLSLKSARYTKIHSAVLSALGGGEETREGRIKAKRTFSPKAAISGAEVIVTSH